MRSSVRPAAGGGWSVVDLAGDLDLGALPELRRVLAGVEPTVPGVVIDLRGVDVLEPEALGSVLAAAARVRRAGGDVRLVADSDHHVDLLRWTGVDRAVRVERSIVDATTGAAGGGLA